MAVPEGQVEGMVIALDSICLRAGYFLTKERLLLSNQKQQKMGLCMSRY